MISKGPHYKGKQLLIVGKKAHLSQRNQKRGNLSSSRTGGGGRMGGGEGGRMSHLRPSAPTPPAPPGSGGLLLVPWASSGPLVGTEIMGNRLKPSSDNPWYFTPCKPRQNRKTFS